MPRAGGRDLRALGVFAVPDPLLVIAELPFELVDAPVDAGVGVPLVVLRDEEALPFGVDDHFHAGRILEGVDDDLDRPTSSDLNVWPQPAGNWLNVAWGESLQAHPSLIVVHDLLGREVIRQGVGESQEGALLSCGDLPPGGYLVSLHGVGGVLLRTVAMVKR